MVHALRELTCSEHKVTTHEPKAREQVKAICKALCSASGILKRGLEESSKLGGGRGECAGDTVEGRVRSVSTGHSQGLMQM